MSEKNQIIQKLQLYEIHFIFGIIKHLEKMGSHLVDGKWEIREYTIILQSPDDVYFYVSMLAKEAYKKCLSAP